MTTRASAWCSAIGPSLLGGGPPPASGAGVCGVRCRAPLPTLRGRPADPGDGEVVLLGADADAAVAAPARRGGRQDDEQAEDDDRFHGAVPSRCTAAARGLAPARDGRLTGPPMPAYGSRKEAESGARADVCSIWDSPRVPEGTGERRPLGGAAHAAAGPLGACLAELRESGARR